MSLPETNTRVQLCSDNMCAVAEVIQAIGGNVSFTLKQTVAEFIVSMANNGVSLKLSKEVFHTHPPVSRLDGIR